jgi:hypothetical protein
LRSGVGRAINFQIFNFQISRSIAAQNPPMLTFLHPEALMSDHVNKALAKRWFEEVWNQGRESTIDELFHPQGNAYGFPEADSVLAGPEGFKTIHRQFLSAFSGIHLGIALNDSFKQVLRQGFLFSEVEDHFCEVRVVAASAFLRLFVLRRHPERSEGPLYSSLSLLLSVLKSVSSVQIRVKPSVSNSR